MNNRAGTDTGSGLVNSQYKTYNQSVSKGTQIFSNVLLPLEEVFLPIPGAEFYFPVLSGQIKVATVGSFGKDIENPYWAGTGLKLDVVNAFSGLQLKNPDDTNPLFYQIVAGFDNYIDNRLTFPSIQYKQICKSTYATYTGPATHVDIPDLSGTLFTDDNGIQYYAVNRQQLTMFNADSAEYWFLMNAAATIYEGLVHPLTSAQLPVSGDLYIKQGVSGSSVNGIVSEIYNCLPKSF